MTLTPITPDIPTQKKSGDHELDPSRDIAEWIASEYESWSGFQRYLATRQEPVDLQNRFAGSGSVLQWGLPCHDEGTPWTVAFQRACDVLSDKALLQANDLSLPGRVQESGTPPTAESALTLLAVATLMPRLAAIGEQEQWVDSLVCLLEWTHSNPDNDYAIVRQLLTIELPLLLAWQFPEIPAFKSLTGNAFDILVIEQEELLDSDGAIHASCCRSVPIFLATWTRSLMIAGLAGEKLDGQSQQKWEWFIRFAMRLLRRDGTSMLGDASIDWDSDLYRAAVATSTDKVDKDIARLVFPSDDPKKKKATLFSEEGQFSAWAGISVMHSDWSPKSPRVAVAYDQRDFRMEVCRGRKLFELNGLPSVSINGKTLKPVSHWEDVCWHSDGDVDYLELEINLDEQVTLQRQICLLREDQALWFADLVISGSVERIDYQLKLDLASTISATQETENTEIYLRDPRIRSLVLAPGLPEWRTARTDDELVGTDVNVTLGQTQMSRHLYAPLFVDLRPKRSLKPRTWRALTVAESLEIVSPDVARAFRVRIGKQQWVFYKSLGTCKNRTFLGQNHSCDFFVGRFLEEGNVDELLSIEP